MRELVVGATLLLVWAALQFGAGSTSGWIHLLLIAGVLLVIRGIVSRDAMRP